MEDIVSLLLKQPGIDVNIPDGEGKVRVTFAPHCSVPLQSLIHNICLLHLLLTPLLLPLPPLVISPRPPDTRDDVRTEQRGGSNGPACRRWGRLERNRQCRTDHPPRCSDSGRHERAHVGAQAGPG